MITTTLTCHFSCAHFYHQPNWSERQNRERFGKCFTPYGHGHDYKLEVSFKDNNTDIKKKLELLVKTLDHQHLNFVIPEFKTKIPTTENLALYCLEKLGKTSIHKLKLFETTNLWIEISDINS